MLSDYLFQFLLITNYDFSWHYGVCMCLNCMRYDSDTVIHCQFMNNDHCCTYACTV